MGSTCSHYRGVDVGLPMVGSFSSWIFEATPSWRPPHSLPIEPGSSVTHTTRGLVDHPARKKMKRIPAKCERSEGEPQLTNIQSRVSRRFVRGNAATSSLTPKGPTPKRIDTQGGLGHLFAANSNKSGLVSSLGLMFARHLQDFLHPPSNLAPDRGSQNRGLIFPVPGKKQAVASPIFA